MFVSLSHSLPVSISPSVYLCLCPSVCLYLCFTLCFCYSVICCLQLYVCSTTCVSVCFYAYLFLFAFSLPLSLPIPPPLCYTCSICVRLLLWLLLSNGQSRSLSAISNKCFQYFWHTCESFHSIFTRGIITFQFVRFNTMYILRNMLSSGHVSCLQPSDSHDPSIYHCLFEISTQN